MALYKNEKINPMAGCLPILLQIPVFFALYKVLFVTIDMRHAPFFGWIKDLSAPDPTSLFNLFGLLPFAVPEFLHVGVWPLIMGMTMWVQMQLNPQQPDPDPAEDLQLDAGDLHLHAGVVPRRASSSTGPGTTCCRCCSSTRSCARTTPRSTCGRTWASTSGRARLAAAKTSTSASSRAAGGSVSASAQSLGKVLKRGDGQGRPAKAQSRRGSRHVKSRRPRSRRRAARRPSRPRR